MAIGEGPAQPDAGRQRPSYAEVVSMVARLADRAERTAAALRDLREPEAAAVVEKFGRDAADAADALRDLLQPLPRTTNWYDVHRDMWIRYGDPGHLAAMTDHVTTGTE